MVVDIVYIMSFFKGLLEAFKLHILPSLEMIKTVYYNVWKELFQNVVTGKNNNNNNNNNSTKLDIKLRAYAVFEKKREHFAWLIAWV